MTEELTKQDILELFAESDRHLREGLEESRRQFDQRLAREAEEREKRWKAFEKSLARSRKQFQKELGELRGVWGWFVEEMVAPNSVELFRQRGIEVSLSVQRVEGVKDGKPYYQIDLLLINDTCAIAVEVKSTLQVKHVDEHLERLDKIREIPPPRIDLKGVTLYGAVAGMIIDQDADVYAMKHGLYVLKQAGNLVKIANKKDFVPKGWEMTP